MPGRLFFCCIYCFYLILLLNVYGVSCLEGREPMAESDVRAKLVRSAVLVGTGAMLTITPFVASVANAGIIKLESPKLVKMVQEDRDGSWSTWADASIGQDVLWKLEGTMPQRVDLYEKYAYAFEDMPSDTIDIDVSSLHVEFVSSPGKDAIDVTDKFTVSYEDNKLRVACDDIRGFEGISDESKLIVSYMGRLKADAKLGFGSTNDNFAHIDHTSSIGIRDGLSSTVVPFVNVSPVLAVSQADGVSSDVSAPIDSTPDVSAHVATYGLRITKVSSDGDKVLEGAKFTLCDDNGQYLAENGTWGDVASAATFTTDANGILDCKGLDAGDYVLEEVGAPSGHKSVGKVDVHITSAIAGDDKSLSASVGTGKVTSVDASSGIVDVRIVDEVSGTDDGGSSTSPVDGNKSSLPSSGSVSGRSSYPGSTSGASGVSGGSSSSPLSKTGDYLMQFWPIALVGAALAGLGIALRRRLGGKVQ